MYTIPLTQNQTTKKEQDPGNPDNHQKRINVFISFIKDACLYIGNLDKKCPEDKLKEICAEYGKF
jgi:RNA recognition motif-containing protein